METEKQLWQKIKRKETSWGVLRSTDWHLSQIWIKTWGGGDSSSVTSAHKLGNPGRLTHHTSWYSFSSCKFNSIQNSREFMFSICAKRLLIPCGIQMLTFQFRLSGCSSVHQILSLPNKYSGWKNVITIFSLTQPHSFAVFNIWISVPSKLKRLCLYLHCPQYFVANNPLRDSISASIPWKMSHDLHDEVKSWIWMWLIPQDLGTSCWH